MPYKSTLSKCLLVSIILLTAVRASAVEPPGLLWKEARRHLWKVRGTTEEDKRTYELVAVDNVRPIYYITYNADAARKTRAAILQDPNFYDPSLDGNSVTVGLWDAGWPLPTHQEFGGRVTIMDGIIDVNDANSVFDEHATNIAGTIASQGAEPSARGMAPGTKLDCYDWSMDATEMAERGASEAGGAGAIYLSNHSYGIIAGWQKGIFQMLPGDFNNDDKVDVNDLAVFAAAWLSTPDSNNWNPVCDIAPFPDGDEIVNFFDYSIMADNWGEFLIEETYWFGLVGDGEDRNFGRYTSQAAVWDELCRQAPYYLPFKAAGNDRAASNNAPEHGTAFWYLDPNEPNEPGDANFGRWLQGVYDANDPNGPFDDGWDNGGFDTLGSIAAAKNIITVGAVDDSNDRTDFTGWGPTDDGRIKPDIMADGFELYSPSAVNDVNYAVYSGTSAACAGAAGSAALLVQYYDDLFNGQAMRASTLKGLIIHTADDLGLAGPDYKYGWGLMDANEAADYIWTEYADANGKRIIEGVITPGTTITYTFPYDGNNPTIRATLCWSDPAVEPNFAAPADINDANAVYIVDDNTPILVNDLDLRIINKDDPGIIFYPYALDPNDPNAPAAPNDNVLDNVEQIYIDPGPIVGDYIVQISHKGTITGGVQHYSLIISERIPIELRWVDDDDDEDRVKYWPDEHVRGPNSSPVEDGSFEHPFDSIQKAINDVNDQAIIIVKDGLYRAVGNYDIDTLGKAATIRKHHEDPDAICTVDCRSQGRAFLFRSGEVATTILDGFIIQNGRAADPNWPRAPSEVNIPDAYGGAIYCNGSSPWIKDCTITDSVADYGGGGIFCDANSSPFISDCDISFNDCGSNVYYHFEDVNQIGGGIYSRGSMPIIWGCRINYNFADGSGGGIACLNSDAWITNCILYDNDCWADDDMVYQYGGGIYCQDGSARISNCLLERNSAAWSGGGVAVLGGNKSVDANDIPTREHITDVNNLSWIAGCLIIDNTSWGSAGGIYARLDDCAVIAQNCLVTNNWGYWSGGISSNFGSLLVVENCTVTNNVASWSVLIGGMECYYAGGDVTNSILCGNRGIQLDGLRDVNDPNIVLNLSVTYSDIEMTDANGVKDPTALWPGRGNINADPLFADVRKDDYHLKTKYHNGRYNPDTGRFDLTDTVTSPCINAGDRRSNYRFEPAPNGARVNMGAYGNTRQASRSP